MAANPFDQFDVAPSASTNPFDQFDAAPSGRQPAFPGSKAHLIPGAETDVLPTPRKSLTAKDIVKGAIEVPVTMAYETLAAPIAAVATGGRPEEWQYHMRPQSETAKRVLGGLAEGMESAKIPALTPGMLVAPGGNLVRPAIQQTTGAVNRLAAPTIEAGVNALAPVVEKIKAPIEARKEQIAAKRSAESYRRAPQIEAAKDAADLGIAINPAESNPTLGTKILEGAAGRARINEKAAEANRQAVHTAVTEELGLDPNATTLNEAAFNQARQNVAPAYDAVKDVELFTADQAVMDQINKLRRDPALIADKALKGEIDSLVDSAVGQVGKGLTGADLLKNVSDLRAKAKTLRNSTSASPKDIEIADTYMGIAKALEEMIDNNVTDPKMLSNYQKARQVMAKTYTVQDLTDLATGIPDVSKLAKVAAEPNALSGNLKKLANVAANYPEAFTVSPTTVGETLGGFSRVGIPGAVGFGLGAMTGIPGAPYVGSLIGAGAGYVGSRALANRAIRPGFQAAYAVPQDFRIMPNQLAAQASQTSGVPVPYDWRNALNQGQPMEQPNWVPGRAEAPAVEIPRLAAPSAEAELNRVQQQRQFQYGQEAAAAERAAQVAEAEAAAGRKPATGGQVYELDPVTGKLRPVDQGLKGATPEVIRNTGLNLESAANKVSSGQKFAMSAEEKIAWDRTKVDLAELAPGFEKLSDKAIAERMMDRSWAEQMVQKARDQARAFEEIATRAADERARQEAFAARERMMDLAEMLDERMRTVKPRVTKHQGPKTREAKRNALIGDTDVNKLNALVQ